MFRACILVGPIQVSRLDLDIYIAKAMDKSKVGRVKRELREERDKIADLMAAIKELEDSKGVSQGEDEEKSCGDDIPLDADARESEWKVRCVFVLFFTLYLD